MSEVQSLAAILQDCLNRAIQQPFSELEVKFCSGPNQGNFTSGISQTQFDNLFKWLSSSTCWRDVRHNEYVDYNFKNHIRGSGGLFNDRLNYITKKTRRHLDIQCNVLLGVRISFKSEIPTSLGIGRDIGTYSSVRVKQRSSFLYKCWSFDLTRVWTGSSPLTALSTQPQADPLNFKLPIQRDRPADSFEFELEFLPQVYLQQPEGDLAVLTESFLARIKELATQLGFLPDKDRMRLLRDINFEQTAQ
jgi:hypothetical protein